MPMKQFPEFFCKSQATGNLTDRKHEVIFLVQATVPSKKIKAQSKPEASHASLWTSKPVTRTTALVPLECRTCHPELVSVSPLKTMGKDAEINSA